MIHGKAAIIEEYAKPTEKILQCPFLNKDRLFFCPAVIVGAAVWLLLPTHLCAS